MVVAAAADAHSHTHPTQNRKPGNRRGSDTVVQGAAVEHVPSAPAHTSRCERDARTRHRHVTVQQQLQSRRHDVPTPSRHGRPEPSRPRRQPDHARPCRRAVEAGYHPVRRRRQQLMTSWLFRLFPQLPKNEAGGDIFIYFGFYGHEDVDIYKSKAGVKHGRRALRVWWKVEEVTGRSHPAARYTYT